MNRAIIDIGTNSVRLLEARKSETGEWDVVRKEINSTRLGEGMTESASIADGSRHRTLKAIEEFAAMARSDGFTDIRAYGTSIMRDAKEGSEFADEITSTSGVPVRILSGREEAYYSYIGAAGTSAVVTSVSVSARILVCGIVSRWGRCVVLISLIRLRQEGLVN